MDQKTRDYYNLHKDEVHMWAKSGGVIGLYANALINGVKESREGSL